MNFIYSNCKSLSNIYRVYKTLRRKAVKNPKSYELNLN